MSRLRRLVPFAVCLVLLMLFFAGVGVAHAQQDITPPTLVQISFDPPVVDTSAGPVTVTVTARFADDLSGVVLGFASFEMSGTTQSYSVQFIHNNRIAGDDLDGTYQNYFVMSQYAAWGDWRLASASALDTVGNSIVWKLPESPELASPQVWPAAFNTFRFRNGPDQTTGAFSLFLPSLGSPLGPVR